MKVLAITTLDFSNVKPPTSEAMSAMDALIAEAKSKGILLAAGGRYPSMFEMKVVRQNGTSTATDGPFTESKELVGGFSLLNVRDREEALEWTNRFLDQGGLDGTCILQEIEMAD